MLDHGRTHRPLVDACAQSETPAERTGAQLSPCLHQTTAPLSPGTTPVCFLKALQNASCNRLWAGTRHTFGFPRGVRHLRANDLPINSELGRDHVWIPVTHTKTSQDPMQVGTWFHYMPGCSDTAWNTVRMRRLELKRAPGSAGPPMPRRPICAAAGTHAAHAQQVRHRAATRDASAKRQPRHSTTAAGAQACL